MDGLLPSRAEARRSLVSAGRFLRRVAFVWTVPLALAVYISTHTVPLVRGWGLPGPTGTAMATIMAAVLLVPFWVLAPMSHSREYDRVRNAVPWVVAAFCMLSVLLAGALLAIAGVEPPVGGLVPWTLGLAAVAAVASYRYAVVGLETALSRGLSVRDPTYAQELADICTDVLERPDLTTEDRTAVEITLAEALVATRDPDAMHDGLTLLDRATSSSNPVLAYVAAMRLVEGIEAKSLLTGDDTGWDRAVTTLDAAATWVAPDRPEARGVAAAAHAQRSTYLAERADDPVLARYLREDAHASRERAVAVTPDDHDDHALHSVVLSSYAEGADVNPLRADLGPAIRSCSAIGWRSHFSFSTDVSASARIVLADLLALRARIALADLRDPRGTGRNVITAAGTRFLAVLDLTRAIWACFGLEREDALATEARMRRPLLRAELALAIGLHRHPLLGRNDRAFADVVREQMSWSHARAADVAANWVDWAVERGDTVQAAEAAWCWVTATAADLRHRVLHDKEDVLSGVQGVFGEAARLLIAGGRPADAALALDLGRAVVLTERMHRSRDGLEERLRDAGHLELADRWCDTEQRIVGSDRAVGLGLRGTDASGLVSAEFEALADHEALLGEISRLPGFEDVDASADFADLRAAAVEGPIVYLAALQEGGFALIVTDAPEPQVVMLPALTTALVAAAADMVPASNSPAQTAAAAPDVLELLWDIAMGPVAGYLPPESLVTLVALGRLAEMPLHMCGTAPDADGVWRDRTAGLVFRYTPNVRVLRRAQRIAGQLGPSDLRLVTVGVMSSPDGVLVNAEREARAAQRLFGPDAVRPDPPVLDAVRAAMDTCTVWHFACHGRYDPVSPLDSSIALPDGYLTARDLMGHGLGRRRLAILSACQTTASAGPMPDEVVGFPSALLQAGVAGVVSCQAEVGDQAAMFLVLAFLQRLRAGEHPPRALASAQAWLRAATNVDLHAAFPDLYPMPRGDWFVPAVWEAERPFADPSTWVLFTYTGA